MGTGDSGAEYSYIPHVERQRRKVAIRLVVALSAVGIPVVLASWLASQARL